MIDPFGALEELPRWLAWREEVRGAAQARPTKVPYDPNASGSSFGYGSSTDPATWGTHAQAGARARQLDDGRKVGCGTVLGDLGDDTYLAGADLDSSLDEDGALAPWAVRIVSVLQTYTEISPSGRGLKTFFRIPAALVRWFLDLIGVEKDAWGCKRGIPGLDGADHGPAVEIYCSARYFTVTGRIWSIDHPHIVALDRDQFAALAELIPSPAGGTAAPTGDGSPGKPGARPRPSKGRDNSRSGKALSAALALAPDTYEEMTKGLREHSDPDIKAWVEDKGAAHNERELKRLWDRFVVALAAVRAAGLAELEARTGASEDIEPVPAGREPELPRRNGHDPAVETGSVSPKVDPGAGGASPPPPPGDDPTAGAGDADDPGARKRIPPPPGDDDEHHKSTSWQDWLKPMGLLEGVQVPPFPPGFLPGALGQFTMQQAFDLQAPLDFVAIPALIASATMIGNEFRMAPKKRANWTERACVWGGCVGYVGDGKTPAFNAAFAPLWPLQKRWREEYAEECKAHKAAVKRARAVTKQWERDAAKALKDGYDPPPMPHDAEPPDPPTCREIITNDVTQERVALLLMNNPRGAMLFRDELSGWFSSFNQYRPGADEQFFLQCHAGGPWLQLRKSGDVVIPDVFLSVFGGLQPDVIAAALGRGGYTGKPDNGLTARFSLLAWPDPAAEQQWVDNSPDRDLRDRIDRLFEHLSTLDPERFVGPRPKGWEHYPPLRFAPEGQEIFRDWYLAHHQAQQAIEPEAQIKGHFAKYDGLFARLALVHHLLRYVQGEKVEPGAVDAVTAVAVRDFIDGYLRPHACKVYGHLGRDPGYQGARRIARWLVENPAVTQFTARDISRKQWAGLTGRNETTGKDYLRAALDHLDNVAGWVRAEEVPAGPRGGRPTTIYLVNPKIPRPR